MTMLYLVMGPMYGHDVCRVPFSLHSKKEDAEWFIETDKKVYGVHCNLIEINLDPDVHPDARQRILDAGITIPPHLDTKKP